MKQETLEDFANEYSKKKYSIDYGYCEEDYYISCLSFIDGAKWQQERSYSEEDMEIAFGTMSTNWICFDEFIEQFKKK